MKKSKLLLILPLILASIPFKYEADASNKKEIHFKDYPIIVACFNQETKEFVAPANESVEDG